jgi:hypothetical protein
LTYNTEGPSVRFQQVYSASDFQRDGILQWQITELRFTVGLDGRSLLLSNVQINLSTTQKVPDGLSSMFAENVGLDNMLVFSGPLLLSAPQTASFNLHIPLQQSFIFDPSVGNLLLDVRNFKRYCHCLRRSQGLEPMER